jgi:hypothetical protein
VRAGVHSSRCRGPRRSPPGRPGSGPAAARTAPRTAQNCSGTCQACLRYHSPSISPSPSPHAIPSGCHCSHSDNKSWSRLPSNKSSHVLQTGMVPTVSLSNILHVAPRSSVWLEFQGLQRGSFTATRCSSVRLFLHCTALHCTALHCTALHCTALHCTALHCTALHCTVLH